MFDIDKIIIFVSISCIKSKEELDDFKNMLARYFAEKAQKDIDALWDSGEIDEKTIDVWGNEHMRTPYAANRS